MKKKIFKVLTITMILLTIEVGTVFALQTSNTNDASSVEAFNQQAAENNTVNEIKDSVSIAETNAQAIIDKAAVSQTATEAVTAEATTAATVATTTAETKAVATTAQKETTTVQEVQQTEAPTKETPVVSGPTAGVALTDNQANSMAYQNASTYAEYVNQVYALINQERTAAGVPTVSKDNTLTIVAMHRSIENAWMNFMEVSSDGHHLRPNGQKASSICSYYNIYGSYGENLGRYQSSPSEIVLGWHNSPAHYSCMTNAKYTKVGIGVAKDSSGYLYWTAIFMD